MQLLLRLLALLTVLVLPITTKAETDKPHFLHWAGVVELHLNSFNNAKKNFANSIELTTASELAVGMNLMGPLSVETSLIYEPVGPAVGGLQPKHGLYAETLFLQYIGESFTLVAGKLDPEYGTAWDIAPGLFGTEFAEEYQLTERLGFGGDVNLNHVLGVEHFGETVLSASIFKADTSFLSDSAFTRRGQASLLDGGASNTKSLSSFSVTLSGSNIEALPGVAYHFGVRSQAAGFGADRREKGMVGGLSYALNTFSNHTMEFIAEVSHIWHADGTAHHQVTVGTVGTMFLYKQWTFSADYSTRLATNNPVLPIVGNSQQVQLSIGYHPLHDVVIEAGWKQYKSGGKPDNVVGFLFSYAFGR
jgi:hypothetical protein